MRVLAVSYNKLKVKLNPKNFKISISSHPTSIELSVKKKITHAMPKIHNRKLSHECA